MIPESWVGIHVPPTLSDPQIWVGILDALESWVGIYAKHSMHTSGFGVYNDVWFHDFLHQTALRNDGFIRIPLVGNRKRKDVL